MKTIMLKRRRRIAVALIFAALLATAIVVPPTLTYSGLCISEMRYVSDAEKIRSVVSSLLGNPDMKYFKQTESGIIQQPGPTPIAYGSVEEFFDVNKNCCSIGPRGGDGYFEPTLLRRLFGSISDIVVVDYLNRYVDEQGLTHSERVTRQEAVDVCGRVVNDFAF